MTGVDSGALSEEQATALGAFVRLLANPNRLRIAYFLLKGERSVAEIEQVLGIRQPTLSQQLGALREGGLVTTRRAAKSVIYALSDRRTAELLQTLKAAFFGEPSTDPRARPMAQPNLGPRSFQAALFGRIGGGK